MAGASAKKCLDSGRRGYTIAATLVSVFQLAFSLFLGLPLATSARAQTVPAKPDSAALPDSAIVGVDSLPHFEPVPDRWREVKPPPYELNVRGHLYDPYNQNVLKGDYPILGQNTFLVLGATLGSTVEGARVPTPSGVSTARPMSEAFFGRGERLLASETVKVSLELFHGQTAFRPRDWELRVTPVFNLNYANLREDNAVNINVRKGSNRTDFHVGFQELSFEKRLANVSDRYDFVSLRVGIQRFGSDFRGFIFNDNNLGVRLFGSAGSNRYQYNIAYFRMLEKDTNSELNTVFDDREQDVAIANLYRQDLFVRGYTGQLSFHLNLDRESIHFDENGFPVRPAVIGNVRPHEVRAYYAGWTGDGHFGRLNVTHAFYHAFGRDEFNSVAGRSLSLNAQLAALELSVDRDWMRFRLSGFLTSGDGDPMDDTGRGFDTIVDEPFFAGGAFSYWNQQRVPLLGVNLVNRRSIVPSLRSSKTEGQPNFVNPGLGLVGFGYDAEITPKLRSALNVNYLGFVNTSSLEQFVQQDEIRHAIGLDYGVGIVYRPLLNNNVILQVGASALTPFSGFDDLYEAPGTQFQTFALLALTY